MFSTPAAPYLTPDSESLKASNWQIYEGEEIKDLPDSLESWAQGTDIELARIVEVDTDSIRSAAGLPDSAELALAVSWMSEATKIRRRVFRHPVDDHEMKIEIKLSGNEIGGRVELRTSLILAKELNDVDPWIANETGAVLLQERMHFAVEGGGSAFPMAVIDFDASPYPAQASWHLVTTSRFDARFSSSFQVLINEQDKTLVKAIEAQKPTKEQKALIDTMMGGIMSEMIQFAYSVKGQDDLELASGEDGTVGSVLWNLLEITGNKSIEITDEPLKLSYQRTLFESMARSMGAGRLF